MNTRAILTPSTCAALIAVAGAFVLSPGAWAQGGNPTITLDEFGVGTIQFPVGPPAPLPQGIPLPDPGPGGLPNALTYSLGGAPGLLTGDLLILDTNGLVSDVIRFEDHPAVGFAVIFYSDLPEPGEIPPPADIGLPGALYPLQFIMTETFLPDGSEGVIYTPTPNQPGFVQGFGVTYVIVSDLVPSPGSLCLLGMGGLAMGRRRRR